MSDGFAVDPDAVVAHAAAVDEYAGKVAQTADAGSRLGLDAFGVVGRFFAWSMMDAARRCSQDLADLGKAGTASASALRVTADAYRAVEAGAVAGFGQVR